MWLALLTELRAGRTPKRVGAIAAMALAVVTAGTGLGIAKAQANESAEAISEPAGGPPAPIDNTAAGSPYSVSSGSRGVPSRPADVANLTADSRSSGYDDFLRVIWVSHGTVVTSLTRGKRAFFTASTFFKPPVTVDAFINFVGNYYRNGQDLAVMRCRPTSAQRPLVSPILATWPNVLPAIASDLGGPGHDCSATNLTPGEKEICAVASQYADSLQEVYVEGLRQATTLASQLYATQESMDALSKDFGIFPAFTGLGFTVQGSSTNSGATTLMLTGDMLANSVVPEYLLINAKLADANCRCVQVPEYRQRHSAPIDPAFVWSHGKLDQGGACRPVRRLATSAQAY